MSDEQATFKVLSESQLALEQHIEKNFCPSDSLVVFFHCCFVSRGLKISQVQGFLFSIIHSLLT